MSRICLVSGKSYEAASRISYVPEAAVTVVPPGTPIAMMAGMMDALFVLSTPDGGDCASMSVIHATYVVG